jgi:phosphoribosylanthranilate isomerase
MMAIKKGKKMKVKVCGLKKAEDVLILEQSQADLIGFINVTRSKRFLKTDEIKHLISSMQNKERAVLVIEPENPEEVLAKFQKTGIKTLQLHSLSRKELNELKKFPELRITRAVGIPQKIDDKKKLETKGIDNEKKLEIEGFSRVCQGILFDYESQGKSGGSGKQIPLKLAVEAAKIARNANNEIEIFLAGGMDAARMKREGKTLDQFFDYVDVNSGVEDQPGVKNPQKIDEFLKATSLIR